MKNITVAVPDEVYRLARVRAAEQGSSVSAMVREYLKSFVADDEFDRRLALQEQLMDRLESFSASNRLRRDELHDRDALR